MKTQILTSAVIFSFLFIYKTENITRVLVTQKKSTLTKHDKATNIVAEPILVLLPEEYRDGNPKPITAKYKSASWYELYKSPKTQKWQFEKAKMQWRSGEDACSGDKTTQVSSAQKNVLLYIANLQNANPIPTTALENKKLVPGKKISFSLGGKTYTLVPSAKEVFDSEGKKIINGNYKKDSEGNEDFFRINNFELSITGSDHKIISLIKTNNLESDAAPAVKWAGDLNNDGLPDFILDMSTSNEENRIFLFVSDRNDSQKPIKKAAETWRVFDC